MMDLINFYPYRCQDLGNYLLINLHASYYILQLKFTMSRASNKVCSFCFEKKNQNIVASNRHKVHNTLSF